MKVRRWISAGLLALCWLAATPNHAAESPVSSKLRSHTEALHLLSQWVMSQQYQDPAAPSYGALKVAPGVAATGTDGTPYYRVSPYIANLGVWGLLRTQTPGRVQTAQGWIEWYFAHLTPQSAPDGVPYEHFYRADGQGETTCVQPDKRALCHYNDATDSAAATFFSVLWAAHEAGLPTKFLNTPEHKTKTEAVATALLKLQQPDGLCWAKQDYRAKYLEDNSEVYAGLRDLAHLEKDIFKDEPQAQLYEQAARRVQQGINELYDPATQLYRFAKFEDNTYKAADLKVWYPDTQAQVWPQLFGVVAATAPASQTIIKAIEQQWNGKIKPDWATEIINVNSGWINADVAFAMLQGGAVSRVQTYLQAVQRLKFPQNAPDPGFTWPFTTLDAGWLLSILAQVPDAPPADP